MRAVRLDDAGDVVILEISVHGSDLSSREESGEIRGLFTPKLADMTAFSAAQVGPDH
jgi:hypothetical protein